MRSFRDRVARAWLRDHSFIRRMADELYPFYRHKMSRQEFDAEFGLDYVAVLEFGAVRALAEQGDIEAQFDLGLMYAKGKGVPQDRAEAMHWYRQAAEQGHVKAQFHLGSMYDWVPKGVPRDGAEAVRWYRRAAEQGDFLAPILLGDMYANGRGVAQDYIKAIQWYRRAAEQQDNLIAEFRLYDMYAEGRAVPDDAQVARWYRRAMEQGDTSAAFGLGQTYDFGKGVPEDNVEAVRWYRRAAEQGYADSQINLGAMYEYGEGVPQDYVQAHKWYNLAAAKGLDKGFALMEELPQDLRLEALESDRERRDKAVQSRNEVASLMTSAQIAEAQRLAREWKPKQFVAPAPDAPEKRRPSVRYPVEMASTGSGFFVSNDGYILTNAHVVSGCADVRIPPAVSVRVAARDDSSDLALLRGPGDRVAAVSTFREGRGIRPGSDVVVIGYPLHGVVASEANVTRGNVSALAGPGDDRRLFQMTAPVQPGNSGGPVLDTSGHVVGVTVAKLDAIKIVRAIGDIPQNVNFAVSAGTARAFLDAEGVPYETARSSDTLAPDVVASRAKEFTVLVECWK